MNSERILLILLLMFITFIFIFLMGPGYIEAARDSWTEWKDIFRRRKP